MDLFGSLDNHFLGMQLHHHVSFLKRLKRLLTIIFYGNHSGYVSLYKSICHDAHTESFIREVLRIQIILKELTLGS